MRSANSLIASAYDLLHKRQQDPDKHTKVCLRLLSRANLVQIQQYDLLRLLMDATFPETGQPMSEKLIVEQANTFIGAGFETTATTLAFAIHCLCENPDAEQRFDVVAFGC